MSFIQPENLFKTTSDLRKRVKQYKLMQQLLQKADVRLNTGGTHLIASECTPVVSSLGYTAKIHPLILPQVEACRSTWRHHPQLLVLISVDVHYGHVC